MQKRAPQSSPQRTPKWLAELHGDRRGAWRCAPGFGSGRHLRSILCRMPDATGMLHAYSSPYNRGRGRIACAATVPIDPQSYVFWASHGRHRHAVLTASIQSLCRRAWGNPAFAKRRFRPYLSSPLCALCGECSCKDRQDAGPTFSGGSL